MTTLTINGHTIPVTSVNYEIDKSSEFDIPKLLDPTIGYQTITLSTTYYKNNQIANMLEANCPKKAKRVKTLNKANNPLKILGLLPNSKL